ncbi:hypothetical protein CVT26_007709, partial [Gymnopilus dilepis]
MIITAKAATAPSPGSAPAPAHRVISPPGGSGNAEGGDGSAGGKSVGCDHDVTSSATAAGSTLTTSSPRIAEGAGATPVAGGAAPTSTASSSRSANDNPVPGAARQDGTSNSTSGPGHPNFAMEREVNSSRNRGATAGAGNAGRRGTEGRGGVSADVNAGIAARVIVAATGSSSSQPPISGQSTLAAADTTSSPSATAPSGQQSADRRSLVFTVPPSAPVVLPVWRAQVPKAGATPAGLASCSGSTSTGSSATAASQDLKQQGKPTSAAPAPPEAGNKAGYSRFRVDLKSSAHSAQPTDTVQLPQILENSEMFRVFKPSSTNAAIGRLITSQPGLSVDVFKEFLHSQGRGCWEYGCWCTPSTGSSASGTYVPTPVVPHRAPFVYKPPPAGGAGAAAAQNSGASGGMRFYDQETLQRGLAYAQAYAEAYHKAYSHLPGNPNTQPYSAAPLHVKESVTPSKSTPAPAPPSSSSSTAPPASQPPFQPAQIAQAPSKPQTPVSQQPSAHPYATSSAPTSTYSYIHPELLGPRTEQRRQLKTGVPTSSAELLAAAAALPSLVKTKTRRKAVVAPTAGGGASGAGQGEFVHESGRSGKEKEGQGRFSVQVSMEAGGQAPPPLPKMTPAFMLQGGVLQAVPTIPVASMSAGAPGHAEFGSTSAPYSNCPLQPPPTPGFGTGIATSFCPSPCCLSWLPLGASQLRQMRAEVVFQVPVLVDWKMTHLPWDERRSYESLERACPYPRANTKLLRLQFQFSPVYRPVAVAGPEAQVLSKVGASIDGPAVGASSAAVQALATEMAMMVDARRMTPPMRPHLDLVGGVDGGVLIVDVQVKGPPSSCWNPSSKHKH